MVIFALQIMLLFSFNSAGSQLAEWNIRRRQNQCYHYDCVVLTNIHIRIRGNHFALLFPTRFCNLSVNSVGFLDSQCVNNSADWRRDPIEQSVLHARDHWSVNVRGVNDECPKASQVISRLGLSTRSIQPDG